MKALVLTSGGVDSATCLALAVKEYGAEEVLALAVYYGQKHKKELEYSQKIAEYYHVKFQTLDLSVIFADSDCSLLINSDKEFQKNLMRNNSKKQTESLFRHMFRSGTDYFYHRRRALHCLMTVK